MSAERSMNIDAIILVAMEEEAAPFLAAASAAADPLTVGNARQHSLTLAGREVLLVQSGIGLVNAAGAATAAILSARAEAPAAAPLVISAGSAGGVAVHVRVGEVVIGSDYLNSGADARAFGYLLGQVPGMPASYVGTETAVTAAESPVQMPDGSAIVVHRGTMVSSDTFVGGDIVDRIRTEFPGVLATDMESVAIAQTAHVHGVPFLAVRGISDLCGPVAGSDFLTHVDDAADRSAVVVLEILRRLAD